jgi:hypothetical protein
VSDAAFNWPVRVYYEDTDSGGVVYYANYLKFLERARTEWLRVRGFDQARLASERGLLFAVREVHLDLRRPARLDDRLQVRPGARAGRLPRRRRLPATPPSRRPRSGDCPVTTDLSIVHLFLGASPIVQLVMLALLVVSLLSWFVIFHRGKVLRWARRDADAFEQRFWSGTELGALFKEISRDDYQASGMERIFEAGFREFARLRRKEGGTGQATIEGAQRERRPRAPPVVPRYGRLHQPLRRPVRHRVGHHELLPRAR